MTISKIQEGLKIELTLEGRLDTTTASQLEAEIDAITEDIDELILNFDALIYLSSAGLRVLLSAKKKMSKQGKMIVRNVNKSILEVFAVTGFNKILTVE